MKIKEVESNIFLVKSNQKDISLIDYYNNLEIIVKNKILTFGDANYRIFENFFKEKTPKLDLIDLCLEDDISIGLDVPNTWYLNKGKHAISISGYYNFLNWSEIVDKGLFSNFNKKITKEYGRIGCVEIYFEDKLVNFLSKNKIKFFGTNKTLTECMRYLEGWDIEKYPRLNDYAAFSEFIKIWSKYNFGEFKEKEWGLGKLQSRKILRKTQTTNIRSAIKFFLAELLI